MRTHLSRTTLQRLHLRRFSCASRFALQPMPVIDEFKASIVENGEHISTPDFSKSSSHSVSLKTSVVTIDARDIGKVVSRGQPWIQDWSLELADSPSASRMKSAAQQICETDIPVAFPTETVYGLGADATRDEAVRAIYRVKGRPSDNPLIVHFASIGQIRQFFRSEAFHEPIPSIYKSLIDAFWPGPLTILLPLPPNSRIAPSVTVGLNTVGVRIPRSPIALALINLADTPLAAPSANASSKPSPTAAEHVAHDLEGRISTILDGGPCDVGVESTVVDGLSSPPAILRPGGVSIEQLRECAGWENVVNAYSDNAGEAAAPRAPGMKYKHYSPKAQVVLYKHGDVLSRQDLQKVPGSFGIVLTGAWAQSALFASSTYAAETNGHRSSSKVAKKNMSGKPDIIDSENSLVALLSDATAVPSAQTVNFPATSQHSTVNAWVTDLGTNTKDIARGLFAALRELDLKHVDTILIEGLDESRGNMAIAVMNRLRKAAEPHVP